LFDRTYPGGHDANAAVLINEKIPRKIISNLMLSLITSRPFKDELHITAFLDALPAFVKAMARSNPT
jgi:hypothetical protein